MKNIYVKKVLLLLVFSILHINILAINRIVLIDKNEMQLDENDIIHLAGIGLVLKISSDSLMLLDNPNLNSIQWLESNNGRSFVSYGSCIYTTQGDSIYRLATETTPHKLVGRLDNEQFNLHPASDSTFYALTADEDFSCVYEIDPRDRTCIPFFSVRAAMPKLSSYRDKTMFWIDDQILLASTDGKLIPVFSSETITDMQLSPLGLFVASHAGLHWISGIQKGTILINEPIARLWWDDRDILYYLTCEGDLIALFGIEKAYHKISSNT